MNAEAHRRAAKRVTMKQIGGDDGYCWSVLVDGLPKWDGMQKREAYWRRQKEIAALTENEKLRRHTTANGGGHD